MTHRERSPQYTTSCHNDTTHHLDPSLIMLLFCLQHVLLSATTLLQSLSLQQAAFYLSISHFLQIVFPLLNWMAQLIKKIYLQFNFIYILKLFDLFTSVAGVYVRGPCKRDSVLCNASLSLVLSLAKTLRFLWLLEHLFDFCPQYLPTT